MIDDTGAARHDYAERVGRQSLQMLVIAAKTQDRAMRDELRAFAARMSAHAIWLCRSADRDARAVFGPSIDAVPGTL